MSRFALISLLSIVFSWNTFAHNAKDMMSGPQIWEQIFVPTLQEKFRRDNHSFSKVESIIKGMGGSVVLDHGGTRTADPQVYAFLTRIANTFGLQIRDTYKFPAKHLEAIDLQLPDSNSFKWFSTLVKYDGLSQEIATAIENDIADSRPHLSERGVDLLEQLEEHKQLSREDATELVKEIVYHYFKRHGRPLSKETLEQISESSPEAANALLLGPDFNHIAVSLNHINIPQWYGLEVIEVIEQVLLNAKFTMLPEIQGQRGGILRQTSIVADKNNFPILLDGKITSSVAYPSKYIEFIQRGADKDAQGQMKFTGGKVKMFQGFLRDNAEKIYSSTDPQDQ